MDSLTKIKDAPTGPTPTRYQRIAIARAIGDRTRGGKWIVDFLVSVMTGTIAPPGNVRIRDRIYAAELLADRLWGKAITTEVQIRLDSEAKLEALPEIDQGTLEVIARAIAPRMVQIKAPVSESPDEGPSGTED